MECLPEEIQIRLSIVMKNELTATGILLALARGETDPKRRTQSRDEGKAHAIQEMLGLRYLGDELLKFIAV
jgi:hypothetical protein